MGLTHFSEGNLAAEGQKELPSDKSMMIHGTDDLARGAQSGNLNIQESYKSLYDEWGITSDVMIV